MLITICAILVSLFMVFFSPIPLGFEVLHSITIILVGATTIFLATIFLNTFILMPLEYLEQKLIPNLMDLIRRDVPLKMGRSYLFIFTLISYLCIVLISRIENLQYQDWFFLAWFVCFGLALDILRDSWRRWVNLLNPSFLISHISNRAEKAIRNDNKNVLLDDLNSLAEISARSVERSKLALSTQALQTFPPLLKVFFDSAKSISNASLNTREGQNQGGDESSYIIFYLMQRFELINDKALRDRQETVCRQMIMTMGKMIVNCAQFDLSLVSFPTHFLTKFGLKAQQHHFDEVVILTTSTLLEIGKTILTEIDVKYAELQDPFKSIVNGLAAIARETFKKYKDANIKVLIQPLVDLKELFKTEKMIQHRDTPAIVQQIDNVLDEFSILEQMMQSIPPISGLDAPEST